MLSVWHAPPSLFELLLALEAVEVHHHESEYSASQSTSFGALVFIFCSLVYEAEMKCCCYSIGFRFAPCLPATGAKDYLIFTCTNVKRLFKKKKSC